MDLVVKILLLNNKQTTVEGKVSLIWDQRTKKKKRSKGTSIKL